MAISKNEFYARINEEARAVLRRAAEAGVLKVRPRVVKSGTSVPPPLSLERPLRREEAYIQRLYKAATEVLESFAALRHAEIYLSRFPFAEDGVRSSAYIRYHLGSFMNELYILQERMDAFCTRMGREFRKDKRVRNLDDRIAYSRAETMRLFSPATEMRGGHVHKERYDDEELSQLAIWEMLAEVEPEQFVTPRDKCVEAVRLSNFEFVQRVNAGISDRLDQFFAYFEGLVFHDDGRLRFPSNIRPPN
jgi:hypothetical protein